MYNPCRGGVRGGADQFTWESVKTDKHRENYLGHSLKAPVGRWQKGKDLSWYAKERKNDDENAKAERSEMLAIKKAEDEAMLIALGHKVTRKESQPVLSKEDITEALKRNVGDRDEHNIERIDGVGSKHFSRRTALLSGAKSDSRSKGEGVQFELHRDRNADSDASQEISPSRKRTKSKKKVKKRKKEKHSNAINCESEDSEPRRKEKKHKRDNDSKRRNSPSTSKRKHKKKSKHKQHISYSSDSDHNKSSKRRLDSRKPHHEPLPRKRQRHDSSYSD